MFLYHYYEESTGPFKNLSDLSFNGAEEVLRSIRRIDLRQWQQVGSDETIQRYCK